MPYTWKVRMRAREFEALCVTNQWNWIDCDQPHSGNAQIALCGELFEIRFDLPYVDFLPEKLALTYLFEVKNLDLRFFLPETNSMRHTMLSLARSSHILSDEGKHTNQAFAGLYSNQWRRVTRKE